MIITQISDKNYMVKIPFNNSCECYFNEQDEILDFFKIIFGKLINKYKINGDVVIDFYLDYDYGIILEIFCENSYVNNINTKIIFHLDCKFLIEVDYFDYIGKNQYLYYYYNKFYDELKKDIFYDGEIIFDNLNILENGIKVHV